MLRALAWKIILLLQSLYFANLHTSSPCTVCNSSIVEKHSIDGAFLGKSASVPHIAAVGINICYRCEQELTGFNEMQNGVEWVGSVFAYALLIPVVCMWLWIAEDAYITFICSSNYSAMVLSQTQLGICASCKMLPRGGSQSLLTIQPTSIATLIWNISEIRIIPGAEVSTYIHFVWLFVSQIPA